MAEEEIKNQNDTQKKKGDQDVSPESQGKGSGNDNQDRQKDTMNFTSSLSTGRKTVTLLRNFTLKHEGKNHAGGTTLEVSDQDAEFLIRNHYAVAGSLLPPGGMLVPGMPVPAYGNSHD